MTELTLPFPPSVNHYWRRVNGRVYISRRGQAFRASVCTILAAQRVRPIRGRLALVVYVYPPDERRRDLDNVLKALLDALEHGGAYADDSQICDLYVHRGPVTPGGEVWVQLVPYDRTNVDYGRKRPDRGDVG